MAAIEQAPIHIGPAIQDEQAKLMGQLDRLSLTDQSHEAIGQRVQDSLNFYAESYLQRKTLPDRNLDLYLANINSPSGDTVFLKAMWDAGKISIHDRDEFANHARGLRDIDLRIDQLEAQKSNVQNSFRNAGRDSRHNERDQLKGLEVESELLANFRQLILNNTIQEYIAPFLGQGRLDVVEPSHFFPPAEGSSSDGPLADHIKDGYVPQDPKLTKGNRSFGGSTTYKVAVGGVATLWLSSACGVPIIAQTQPNSALSGGGEETLTAAAAGGSRAVQPQPTFGRPIDDSTETSEPQPSADPYDLIQEPEFAKESPDHYGPMYDKGKEKIIAMLEEDNVIPTIVDPSTGQSNQDLVQVDFLNKDGEGAKSLAVLAMVVQDDYSMKTKYPDPNGTILGFHFTGTSESDIPDIVVLPKAKLQSGGSLFWLISPGPDAFRLVGDDYNRKTHQGTIRGSVTFDSTGNSTTLIDPDVSIITTPEPSASPLATLPSPTFSALPSVTSEKPVSTPTVDFVKDKTPAVQTAIAMVNTNTPEPTATEEPTAGPTLTNEEEFTQALTAVADPLGITDGGDSPYDSKSVKVMLDMAGQSAFVLVKEGDNKLSAEVLKNLPQAFDILLGADPAFFTDMRKAGIVAISDGPEVFKVFDDITSTWSFQNRDPDRNVGLDVGTSPNRFNPSLAKNGLGIILINSTKYSPLGEETAKVEQLAGGVLHERENVKAARKLALEDKSLSNIAVQEESYKTGMEWIKNAGNRLNTGVASRLRAMLKRNLDRALAGK